MKVLFLTYPRIGLNRGGLQIQIEETARGLSKQGIEVVSYNPWKNQIQEVDLCHVFSIDASMIYHVKRAMRVDVPVILSPVLSLFGNKPFVSQIKYRMSGLPGVYSDLKRAGQMLSAASKVIALNGEERDMLMRVFQVESSKIDIVPNGISAAFSGGDPELFVRTYGLKDFVLNVASIQPKKNQLSLVRAMKNLPYTLVLVGKASPEHDDYFIKVKAEAGPNVRFLGAIQHDDPMLASCYRAAKLFVLPSFSEVMPLTINEAVSAGCRVLVSSQVPVLDSIVPRGVRFRPDDIGTIAQRINRNMQDREFSNVSQSMVVIPTWEEICDQLMNIYRQARSVAMVSRQVPG
nr:glycosyltransferase family 4 protein [Nitrosomonas nitrosa]